MKGLLENPRAESLNILCSHQFVYCIITGERLSLSPVVSALSQGEVFPDRLHTCVHVCAHTCCSQAAIHYRQSAPPPTRLSSSATFQIQLSE